MGQVRKALQIIQLVEKRVILIVSLSICASGDYYIIYKYIHLHVLFTL